MKLLSPKSLLDEFPLDDSIKQQVKNQQNSVKKIFEDGDSRLLLIVGPCSIHDQEAALEYADKLSNLQTRVNDTIKLVMRVYFEKPRSLNGWKGLLLEPSIDSVNPNLGLKMARELLIEISKKNIAIGTEFLTPYTPLYYGDLISWGSVGARTTACPLHRQMGSSLSIPCGFKNSIDGSLDIAYHALLVASNPQSYLGIDEDGAPALINALGNPLSHLVLRGSQQKPNYKLNDIASKQLKKLQLFDKVLIDCSHDNSRKIYSRQPAVFEEILSYPNLFGAMIESHLFEGKESPYSKPHTYGVSITDGCIGWSETEDLILMAHEKRIRAPLVPKSAKALT